MTLPPVELMFKRHAKQRPIAFATTAAFSAAAEFRHLFRFG